jgi:hypothetical protein
MTKIVFRFVMSASAATEALSRLVAQPCSKTRKTAAHHSPMRNRIRIHCEGSVIFDFMVGVSETSGGRNPALPIKEDSSLQADWRVDSTQLELPSAC